MSAGYAAERLRRLACGVGRSRQTKLKRTPPIARPVTLSGKSQSADPADSDTANSVAVQAVFRETGLPGTASPETASFNAAISRQRILRFRSTGEVAGPEPDSVAVEEPLEIRVEWGPAGDRRTDCLSITMRSPGHDQELALGFLFTEGLIEADTDVQAIRRVGKNGVLVKLEPQVALDTEALQRHFYTTSSCGVCGKASIQALKTANRFTREIFHENEPWLTTHGLCALPGKLRAAQAAFVQTGGIHASGCFDEHGELLSVREDVGRHNALDKIVGAALSGGTLPLRRRILVLSGRASFELIQKAAMAGIPVVAAVGAPSSLALELAAEMKMTLVGFLSDSRFNLYSGPERLRGAGHWR